LYNREKKTAEPLFTSNSALAKYQMANVKPVSFTARDGLKVHGYLTLPPNVKPEKLPLVVVVHGGPWARDIWYFDPEIQWFANRGYAALQINFRGSAGYGKQFLNAGNREWGGKMQDDLTDGKNWAIAQGIADPQRVAIFGGSYGGYAVLAGLTFTPNEFACGVDMFGISNLQTFLDSIPPYWETFRSVLDNRLGRPTETEYLKSRSPITKIDQIKVPLLIAQGGNDPRVKKAESEQMVAALKQAGKGVEYIYFPDEGHGFVKPENKMKFYDAVEKFLAQHLGGRTETTP
jgi:dipeptidyl aminopeptidase/acylaminoacyl peptidase